MHMLGSLLNDSNEMTRHMFCFAQVFVLCILPGAQVEILPPALKLILGYCLTLSLGFQTAKPIAI